MVNLFLNVQYGQSTPECVVSSLVPTFRWTLCGEAQVSSQLSTLSRPIFARCAFLISISISFQMAREARLSVKLFTNSPRQKYELLLKILDRVRLHFGQEAQSDESHGKSEDAFSMRAILRRIKLPYCPSGDGEDTDARLRVHCS